MKRGNRNNMDTEQTKHAFFFFGNEQSIINVMHLFMIRRPYKLLNNNESIEGRQTRCKEVKDSNNHKESMDSTSIFRQIPRKNICDVKNRKENIKKSLDMMSLVVAHENRAFPWLQFLWSIFVPSVLCISQQLLLYFLCIEISTLILDIRWDIACWMILIFLYHFSNPLYLVNNDNVFKSQFYDRISIANAAFFSVILRFQRDLSLLYGETVKRIFFKSSQRHFVATKISQFFVDDDDQHKSTLLRRRGNTINSKNNPFFKQFFILLTMINMIQFPSETFGLRCYTDITASKSNSQECGLNTGCVKIFIDSEEMLYRKQTDMGFGYGYKPDYELPPQYMNDPVLVRGCFVLKVPDRCYTAKNGLSYCWCSTKDLCNSASSLKMNLLSSYGQTLIQSVLSRASFLYSHLWWWHNDVHSMKKEDDTTILVDYDCYQLFLSAFFWFCYNNGVMHRLFLPTILHQNVL